MRDTVSKRSTEGLAKSGARPSKPPPIGHSLPPPIEPLVLRPKQAARALSVSERTLWTLIGTGRLEVSRVGGVTLVHMASIRALLAPAAPTAP